MSTESLQALSEIRGVRYAALINPQGAVEESVGSTPEPRMAQTAKAMVNSLKAVTQAGEWNDLLLDLETGPLLLTRVGDKVLQVAFSDLADLGRVRFGVGRVVSKLA